MKKLQTGWDLAVVQFNSKKTYTVGKIGNSDTVTKGTLAYVSGFPDLTAAIPDPISPKCTAAQFLNDFVAPRSFFPNIRFTKGIS